MTDLKGLASDQTFVAFDIEATGLSPLVDRIVEVAAVAFRAEGTEIASFERLVNPGIRIPPAQTLIHGITDKMVSDQPAIQEALLDFARFIGDAVLVAHNAPSDVAMIMVPAGSMSWPDGCRLGENLVLDTCTLSRALLPKAPNHRLATVADSLGIPRGRSHRAMPDVAACKAIFLKVLEHCGAGARLADLIRLDGSELYLGIPPADALERLTERMNERFRPLVEAIGTGSPVAIEYHGGSKGTNPRLVTPVTVMRQMGVSCLVAHCHLDGALKNFRLDRISAVRADYQPPRA